MEKRRRGGVRFKTSVRCARRVLGRGARMSGDAGAFSGYSRCGVIVGDGLAAVGLLRPSP
jgi:hypothetical protein